MGTTSLRNMVAKDILDNIQRGEISPNETLSEVSICAKLGISRTPAREALIELEAGGILEKIPRKGYRVRDMDVKTKLDHYEILAVLDALSARLALPGLDDDDLRRMSELVDLMDVAIKYENYAHYCELQEQFHHVYIDKCDNKPLRDLLSQIKASVIRYNYYSTDTKALFDMCRVVNQEHREIVELIRNKDADGLSKYLTYTHWITKNIEMI